ncbi:sodium/hydrogen exchanger 9B2-like [Hyposmocoma kahamanoa]|uniref:sodium/hydrogen exchanger 9B2-like n=1 Tax=Hyposmocoma kahamanoa TaxID=1477025 RepID=UPI000E6D6835|nr:sodium/hydrogen exchanger 9B2-like [Hyposmocoma kahamanoa]
MTLNGHDTGKLDANRPHNVTSFELGPSKTSQIVKVERTQCLNKLLEAVPPVRELKQYLAVALCGITIWATAWFVFQDDVLPGKSLFSMSAVVIVGYIFGHTLERYTTVNAVVGMTLIGALYRNLGPPSFLDNKVADAIDYHLSETRLHLGSILASVSPAIVVPTVMKLSARGLGAKNQISNLVANAGGLDTAFTEGMCGVINSAIFIQATLVYKIIKALLAIFVGIGLGIILGVIMDYLPEHTDTYAPTIRSLFIFTIGILMTYAGGYLGWGGISGVAIMVCASAAATRWSRRGWTLNNNPVSEVYKVLWRIFEPMLFTLSGYFLDVSQISMKEFCLIIACIFCALFLRLITAFLVSLANELSLRESLFIAVTWIPKAIVEAVLVRVATDSLWTDGATNQDERIAAQHSNIIVIAILITSTIGSTLTTILGPILLSQDSRVAPEDFYRTQTLSPPQSSDNRRNINTSALSYIDIQ